MKGVVVQRLYLFAMAATLGAIAWMSFTQPVRSTAKPQAQAELFAQVPAALDPNGAPPTASPAKSPGSALAYMTVPRFGEDWLWTVVEGTSEQALSEGPGHYDGTALPGAVGNFTIAAHRAGHGDPFIDFDRLRVGDEITFRQSGAWWTYTVDRDPVIFEPGETWMLRQPAHRRLLTLTTCWPKYGNEKRMFVSAVLSDWSGK